MKFKSYLAVASASVTTLTTSIAHASISLPAQILPIIPFNPLQYEHHAILWSIYRLFTEKMMPSTNLLAWDWRHIIDILI